MGKNPNCEMCDINRGRSSTRGSVGDPCNICDGTGTDYIGRACRHCNPASAYYAETQANIKRAKQKRP